MLIPPQLVSGGAARPAWPLPGEVVLSPAPQTASPGLQFPTLVFAWDTDTDIGAASLIRRHDHRLVSLAAMLL